MRRVVTDGVELYEILVDHEGEGLRDVVARTSSPMHFVDPAMATVFLERVADDYTEKLALRQVMERLSGRDDMYQMRDDEVIRALAERLVGGALVVNRLSKQ